MSRTVDLTTLISRVRRRVNVEGAANPSDSEVTDNLNESIAAWHDLVRSAYGQEYFHASYAFSTVGQVTDYALPADFLSLISLRIIITNTSHVMGTAYNRAEEARLFSYGSGWRIGYPVRYRLLSHQNIRLLPYPNGAFQITLDYVPTPPKLVNPGDVFDGINGWEEWVVLNAAELVATKIGDTELLMSLGGRKALEEQRIRRMAPDHDAGTPERVQVVERDDGMPW